MLRRFVTAVAGVVCAAAAAGAAVAPASHAAPAAAGAGKLTVTISGLPRHSVIALDGAPLRFVVTVRNGTRRVERNITPVVAIDHCNCTHTPVEMAPAGTLQELDRHSGKWHTVFYDRVGSGMDYLVVVQQRPFTLGPGRSASFVFRLSFASQKHQPVRVFPGGRSGILVSVVREPVNLSKFPVLARVDDPVAVSVR